MWDLQSGKLLRSITDAHPMGSAVLHVMVRRGGDTLGLVGKQGWHVVRVLVSHQCGPG